MRKLLLVLILALISIAVVGAYSYYVFIVRFSGPPVEWGGKEAFIPNANTIIDYPLGIKFVVVDKNALFVEITAEIVFNNIDLKNGATIELIVLKDGAYYTSSNTAVIQDNKATVSFTVPGPANGSTGEYELAITIKGIQEIKDNASIHINIVEYKVKA